MPMRRKLTEEEKVLMRELRAQGNKLPSATQGVVFIAHVTGRSESVVHRAVRRYRGRW